jgi:probable rRNA maturation factor
MSASAITFHNQHPRRRIPGIFLKKIRPLLKKILSHERYQKAEVNIIMITNPAIKKLNHRYHHRLSSTDVLAFGFYHHKQSRMDYGDIYISLDKTVAQAAAYKVTFRNELARLMVHGLLHLCGHEDTTQPQRHAMERRVERWVQSLKI